MWVWFLLFFIGLMAGTIGSIVGLGGGIIIVPALLILGSIYPQFQEMTPSIAVGTSLLLIMLTALASTLTYAKQKRIDFSRAGFFFITSGPGAIIGAFLSDFVKADFFFISFGIFMVIISIILTVKDRERFRSVFQSLTCHHRITVPLISFIVGILSGLFGIGGGVLMVPMMIILFAYPPHIATATSMFLIFLSAIAGSLIHFLHENIHWFSVAWLAPGAWIGGYLGAWISARLSGKVLIILLRMAILLVAIRMIWKGFHVS